MNFKLILSTFLNILDGANMLTHIKGIALTMLTMTAIYAAIIKLILFLGA